MGTRMEFNDTLQISREQGFPGDLLDWERHRRAPIDPATLAGREFRFHKPEARFFHLDPCRVYLVESVAGKWLFWGRAMITSQTISKALAPGGAWAGEWVTSGTFTVATLYDPAWMEAFSRRESPPGKSYFG